MLPNLYPLGTPYMINHVQRGQLRVNESPVIGSRVLVVDVELRERLDSRMYKTRSVGQQEKLAYWCGFQSLHDE